LPKHTKWGAKEIWEGVFERKGGRVGESLGKKKRVGASNGEGPDEGLKAKTTKDTSDNGTVFKNPSRQEEKRERQECA